MLLKIVLVLIILTVMAVIAAYSKSLDKFFAFLLIVAACIGLYFGYQYLHLHGLPW